MGIGGDGEAGVCPVVGDSGLLVGLLGTALDDHHVHMGSILNEHQQFLAAPAILTVLLARCPLEGQF